MVDRFQPLPWNDGPAGGTPASVARGPRRWEKGIDDIDTGLDDLEDRVDALAALVSDLSRLTGTSAERELVAPDVGQRFYDTTLHKPVWGDGTAWRDAAGTIITGSGSSNAPTNFAVSLGGDRRAVMTWNAVTSATTYEVWTFGVSGPELVADGITGTTYTSAILTQGQVYSFWANAYVGGVRSAASNTVTITVPAAPGGGGGGTPAEILNIGTGSTQNHFNVGIGYSTGHVDKTMDQIIGGFAEAPYFTPNATGTAVQFSIFANGKTTSGTTIHPRSELRELKADGTKAAWNAGSGLHVMSGISKATFLAPDSESSSTARPWFCFGQIHDALGDVVRLQCEGNFASGFKLWARTHTPNGDAATEVKTQIATSYTVGNDIVWKIEANNGTVRIYIDNVVKATVTGVTATGCYFKAGDYQQFSTVSSDGGYKPTSTSRVELRSLVVTHS